MSETEVVAAIREVTKWVVIIGGIQTGLLLCVLIERTRRKSFQRQGSERAETNVPVV